MSVVERSPRPLKRDHDAFKISSLDDLDGLEPPCSVPPDFEATQAAEQNHYSEDTESLPTPLSIMNRRDHSPARSNTGSLSDAGPTTPSLPDRSTLSNSTSTPSTFAAMNGSVQPPAKKAKLTFAEKEEKRIMKEIKDRERADERAKKEAEKKAQAEEKEVERKKKEAEKEEKRLALEEKRLAHEAEKLAKEEKKKKKEDEKRKAEEAKNKKERSQMKLGNFFAIPASRPRAGSADSHGRTSASPGPASSNLAPNPATPTPAVRTPSKPQISTYEKLFPEFFIRDNVTVAPINRFMRDEAASAALQSNLDAYVSKERSPGKDRSADALALFRLPYHRNIPRGRQCIPMRQIMADIESGSNAIDPATDSQQSRTIKAQELLRRIPVKILHFREDVRPPYIGTYTSEPLCGKRKLARNPMRRDLPETNYDYDSEAEWVEDEDAEDLKSEGDEDEEVDDDEDMEGFLDDENDDLINSRRMVVQGDLEPISTGLCWEDRKKRNANVKLVLYRMENILDPKMKSIDPFSTAYWDPPKTSMEPPRLPLNTMKTTSANINGSSNASATKPVKPFFSSNFQIIVPSYNPSNPASSSSNTPMPPPPAPKGRTPKTHDSKSKPKKLIPAEDMAAFKAAVQGSDLSKIGLVEVLKKRFQGSSGAVVKATLEAVARRVGGKEVDKRWVLIDEKEGMSGGGALK